MYNDETLDALREFYLSQDTAFLPDLGDGVAGTVIGDLAKLAIASPPFIPLAICSNGGNTHEGFALAQFIEFQLKVPVHATVFGACCSAATYALLCSKERVGDELTRYVLHHQTSSGTFDYGAHFQKEIDGWVKDNREIHATQVRFYSTKLGIPKKKMEKIMKRGSAATNNALSARKALDIGLLTEVTKLSKSS